jgi:hypothetical protein
MPPCMVWTCSWICVEIMKCHKVCFCYKWSNFFLIFNFRVVLREHFYPPIRYNSCLKLEKYTAQCNVMWGQGLYCQPSACVTDAYTAFIHWLGTYRTVPVMLTHTQCSQWPPMYHAQSSQWPPMYHTKSSQWPPMYHAQSSQWPRMYHAKSSQWSPTYHARFSQWPPMYHAQSSQWPPMYPTTSPMHVHACVHETSLGFTFYT